MKNPIITFVLGLLLGAILIYLLFGNKSVIPFQPQGNLRSLQSLDSIIKNSSEYQNPTLFTPHDLFSLNKSRMEDTKDLFAGIKIDRDVVDSLMASTGGKSNFYIVMGLDSLRNKKILIAAEPDSNTWKLDTLNHDFIWTLAYDAKGKQYLQSEFSGYDSPRFIAQNSTNAINKDLFNEFIKYALPVTSAMGATVCKCPTCCGSVQSSLLQPSGQ